MLMTRAFNDLSVTSVAERTRVLSAKEVGAERSATGLSTNLFGGRTRGEEVCDGDDEFLPCDGNDPWSVVSVKYKSPAMEMKKIACVVLVAAASATAALAADAPAPSPASASFAVSPAIGAVLGASVLSFFAFYLQ
ncbi:hypothetical protein Cni_G25990 [Canna indica]|uniref:Uncharacterized protein n=1 Tax=Canna indica TaxID=4628 RepID=A0AAQ3L2V5_9LILI|nr:hypothetical protein Cni_G25990 [Canna indica]